MEQTYREALRDGMAEEKRQQAVRVAVFDQAEGAARRGETAGRASNARMN